MRSKIEDCRIYQRSIKPVKRTTHYTMLKDSEGYPMADEIYTRESHTSNQHWCHPMWSTYSPSSIGLNNLLEGRSLARYMGLILIVNRVYWGVECRKLYSIFTHTKEYGEESRTRSQMAERNTREFDGRNNWQLTSSAWLKRKLFISQN